MDIKIIADVRIRKPDRNGNTYHDIVMYDLNGNKISERQYVYGYGSQYIITICDMLSGIGITNDTNWYYLNHVLALAHTY